MVKLLPVALALAALASALPAQSLPDRMQTGNGARAMAMGHAMTATVNDATALGWNPAGLSSIQRIEMEYVGSLRLVQPDPRFDGTYYEYSSVQVSSVTAPVSFASLAVPMEFGPIAVVGAVAYRALHDWAHTEEIRSYFAIGEQSGALRERRSRQGGVYAYSGGVGVSFWERLRVGAAVNVLTGATQTRSTLRALGPVWSDPGTTTSKTEVRGYSGTSIDLGAIVHVGEKLRIGTKLGLPYSRESDFEANNGTVTRSRVETPMTYAVGLMYNSAPGRVWALDVRHEPWTKGTATVLNTGAQTQTGSFDITSYHIGYERSEDFQGTRVSTRTGLFYRPTAFGDFEGDQIIGYGGSLGRAWRWHRVGFDLSGSYVFYGEHVRNDTAAGRFAVAEQEIQMMAGFQVFFR
jgi:hypothetical protein